MLLSAGYSPRQRPRARLLLHAFRNLSASKRFDVSVVVCTRNRAESLARLLPTLARQALPSDLTAEVVVVDNGSTDETAQVVRRHSIFGTPVTLIQEAEKGLSRARNAGIAAARGNVLLFTDDDVELPTDWLALMSAPILSGRADAVAGTVTLAPHLLRSWMEPFHRATLAATDYLPDENPGVMMGASMGFGRHVLAVVNGFDVNLGAGALGTAEETLFAWQLVDAGLRIARVAEPAVVHHFPRNRLGRAAYVSAAAAFGRSYGYISYHWLHATNMKLDGMSDEQLRRAHSAAVNRLIWWRMRNPAVWLRREGISRSEFYRIMRVHFIRQFILERAGPRRYTPVSPRAAAEARSNLGSDGFPPDDAPA